MSEPITWQLVEWIAARMKLIDGGEGWHTSIDANAICTERAQLRDRASHPQLLVSTGEINIDAEQSGQRTTALSIELIVQYMVPMRAGLESEKLAHRALADMRRALQGAVTREAPLKLRHITVNSCSVLPDAEGAHSIFAQVIAQAGVSESLPPA